MSFRQSSKEDRWAIISKYNELKRKNPDISPLQVYNKLRFNGYPGISESLVKRTIKRFESTGDVSDRPQKNKKRKITERVKKSVLKRATNKKIPKYKRSKRKIAQLQHGSPKKKIKISYGSVTNILKDNKKHYKRPKRIPLVTPHHRRMKKLWGKEHLEDTVEDWEDTLVIDETHFETFHRSNRQNSGEWCDENEEAEPEQTVKHSGRVNSSMGVCGRGAAKLDLYTDRFNQNKFKDVHLEKQYHPAMRKFKCNRLLMDNDRSHHAKKVIEWFEENDIYYSGSPPPPCGRKRCRCEPPDGLWFPAYAPEVSPAELYNNYVQQELDKLSQRLGHPSGLKNLKQRVQQIVRKTPKSYFKKLMAGMPARVKKMYIANGGNYS